MIILYITLIITGSIFIAMWLLFSFYLPMNDIVIGRIKANSNYDSYEVITNKNAIYEHPEKFELYSREITIKEFFKFIINNK